MTNPWNLSEVRKHQLIKISRDWFATQLPSQIRIYSVIAKNEVARDIQRSTSSTRTYTTAWNRPAGGRPANTRGPLKPQPSRRSGGRPAGSYGPL